MADPNIQLGQVLQTIPLEYLIATPFSAACEAQTRLAESSLNFIKSVTYDQYGNTQTLQLSSSTTQVDPVTNQTATSTKTATVPLVTMINLPCMYIQKVDLDLVVEVNAISQNSASSNIQQNTALCLNTNASYALGGFSASANVSYNAACSLSSQSTAQRQLNTKATYTLHVEATNEKPPGLTKMLDFLL